MNKAQFLAADPKVSAWVTASAGTGKTKVLTDRILNLLLQGSAPERIVCLTFTKAAASEMANRLTHKLANWVTLSPQDLSRELEELSGTVPSLTLLERARQLFTIVLDARGGMKIQTIHGFCQTVLSRFPLEAGIPPNFRVLDEREIDEMFTVAQHEVLLKHDSSIENALALLSPILTDRGFKEIMSDLYQYQGRVKKILEKYKDWRSYGKDLFCFLEIDKLIKNEEEILEAGLVDRLKSQYVSQDIDFDSYVYKYLTKDRKIRKKLSNNLQFEAERVLKLVQSLSILETAQKTIAILVLFQEIMKCYQARKIQQNALDYDDLIYLTQRLLQKPTWSLYKLDGGIDHLLIDEAQDTSTIQWEIVRSLTAEFFTGDKIFRTVFAVGDTKQSIYSFQGADPDNFVKMKEYFSALSQNEGRSWRDVQLNLSYRSLDAILSVVDEVFANERYRRGVSFDGTSIVHQVFRQSSPLHLPGLVEIWPLIESEEVEGKSEEEWELPLVRTQRRSPESRLADFVADQIALWLQSGGVLPSTNLPIQPRDILILVRKRTQLVDDLIRALKQRNIPIAGSDRLILTDHIAIMDLLALGQFILLPDDDFNLACVLRSPLINMSEEDLFLLAHGREGSLWSSLLKKSQENPLFELAHQWLNACLQKVDHVPVFEFYSWVLNDHGGRRRLLSRLGSEIEDPLEEFLAQSLKYDQNHASSLQGFIHFICHQHQEIKRDASDTAHNQIRLMTIHGAKGLQAPIVILPDATESEREKNETFLWMDHFFMLRPKQEDDSQKTLYFKNKQAEQAAAEKRRLLYVALTRAQDRFYVGGWTKKKELSDDCWYRIIQSAVRQQAAIDLLFPENKQVKLEEHVQLSSNMHVKSDTILPSWVKTIPSVPTPLKADSEPKTAPSSPALDRGILIHKFFEYLPALSPNDRYDAAWQMLKKTGWNLSENERVEWENDIQNTLNIMENPTFKNLFGPNSLAEVPITGVLDGATFEGRIDRLLITADTVTIVDYKTNRQVPLSLKDVPEIYIKQLKTYEDALRTIYPHHKIYKMLLWTAGPMLQTL